jgi:hypothetical protein
LLEPQRTNDLTYSEQLNNAAWTKSNATISANAATSPDGYTNADKLIPSNGASLSSISNYALQSITKAASAIQYTYSTFVKQDGLNRVNIIAQGASIANNASATFSLVNGSIATAAAAAGTFTGASASVTDYGNGWYRCALVFTTNTDTALTIRNIPTDSTLTTGNGTNGILIYGAQLEAGAYATSYIPTLGTSVTRVADAATKSGIGSLIGTEFTLFFDGFDTVGGASTRYMALKGTGGTYANALIIESNSSNQVAVYLGDNSSSAVFNAISGALTNGQRMKFAIACKNSDIAFYLNGSLVASQSSGTIPTMTDLYLGSYVDYIDNYCLVNQAIIFENRLTNAQLASLTSL